MIFSASLLALSSEEYGEIKDLVLCCIIEALVRTKVRIFERHVDSSVIRINLLYAVLAIRIITCSLLALV